MTSYCALLRGISPGKPGNDKLRETFTGLGFEAVSTLLSSGNVLFTTSSAEPVRALEDRIQKALQEQTGIGGGTILRSREELQALVEQEPFGELIHGKTSYLTITFLKEPQDHSGTEFPAEPLPHVQILKYDDARVLLAVVDQTRGKTPDYMSWLQRNYGKEITTRTWQTVTKVLAKLPAAD